MKTKEVKEFSYGIACMIDKGHGWESHIEDNAEWGPDAGEPGQTAEEFAEEFAKELASQYDFDDVKVDGAAITYTDYNGDRHEETVWAEIAK